MESSLPDATWKDRLLYLLGRRLGFLVEGDSMSPALKNGDAVLIDSRANISTGDIVLAKHPFRQSVRLLKRLAEIGTDGKLTLLGDNSEESTDSRTLGGFSRDDILGKVVCRLK
jgi:nickel-type superoxide dismutase maturation protease